MNGKLFEETLSPASFDTTMRNILLESTTLDWGKISPAIFGSLFQSVMNPMERRNLGAHYTSEKNILKVIKPLFLDDLWKEFDVVKDNRNKLIQFHAKLATLRFLDPACGCGNFLVISYRELRLLELEIIKILQKGQQVFDISEVTKLDVDRFYGIEIEEFPSQIAQVAMWLMDHQMNMRFSEEFGQYYLRLPLRKSANIVCANALRIDWQRLIEPIPWEQGEQRFDYIYGNPPFVGKQMMNPAQKADMKIIFTGVKGAGVLDFVTAWYIRAAQYVTSPPSPLLQERGTRQGGVRCAFVSTNSISQGEQVGILWNELFNKYKIKIYFAHRTFKWSNEARGKAAVHVVIIGFSNFDVSEKRIFEYENIKGEPHVMKVSNINPYLVGGSDIVILSRSTPICNVSNISYGSMANDGGFLILSEIERNKIIDEEPNLDQVIHPFLGSEEFINNYKRFCFWLPNVDPGIIRNSNTLMERISKVKSHREKSPRATTRALASTPTLFGENRQPMTIYLLIPGVSSETRKYIPIGFLTPEIIASDLCRTISNANLFLFGILTSEMHMAWVKHVCGRLKSDFRYSNSIVYNNFPWPENPTEKQVKTIEDAAQKVLNIRRSFPGSSLADLYDPLTMPPDLVKAHQELDKAVDLCYRPQPFPNETKRIEFLFELYDKYTAGLFAKEKKR